MEGIRKNYGNPGGYFYSQENWVFGIFMGKYRL